MINYKNHAKIKKNMRKMINNTIKYERIRKIKKLKLKTYKMATLCRRTDIWTPTPVKRTTWSRTGSRTGESIYQSIVD